MHVCWARSPWQHILEGVVIVVRVHNTSIEPFAVVFDFIEHGLFPPQPTIPRALSRFLPQPTLPAPHTQIYATPLFYMMLPNESILLF